MRGLRRWGLIACVLAAAGCARGTRPPTPAPPPEGRVSYHAVADKSVRRYAMRKDVSWSQPRQSRHNAAPAYPPALLDRHLGQVTVTVLLVVDAHGRVTDVRFPAGSAVEGTTRAFREAVRKATLTWTFVPLVRSFWETRPDGTQVRTRDQPMPFSQTYAFRFAVRDGKPVVSAAMPGR